MHGYLSADIICSEKRTVFRERSSRKTVSFEEQIMSNNKYPCIFLKTNGDYCVYYPSNIFRTVARAGTANLIYCVRGRFFFVFRYGFFDKQVYVFLRNNGKTFPHLKFLKQDLHRISNSSFENWGISLELGNITRIFPNFGWGILCHVTRFDQSRASENI